MCDYEDKKGKNIFTKIIFTKKCNELENFDINKEKKDNITKFNHILLGHFIVLLLFFSFLPKTNT